MMLKIKNKLIKKVKHQRKSLLIDILAGTAILAMMVLVLLAIRSNIYGDQDYSDSLFDGDISISFVGDIMMSRYSEIEFRRQGYEVFFGDVMPVFAESDYVVANLESPVVYEDENYQVNENAIVFSMTAEAFADIANIGIDLFSFANNHIGDFGYKGILDTMNITQDLGVETVGLYEDSLDITRLYHTKEINGLKLAFISSLDFTFPKDRHNANIRDNSMGIINSRHQLDLLLEVLAHARKNNDLVFVFMHWGIEYDNGVSTAQKELGEILIDNGADLIIGAHPHVLQPVTYYKGRAIVNSLGNFVFNQVMGPTSLSAILTVSLSNSGDIERLGFTPILIDESVPKLIKQSFYSQSIMNRLVRKTNSNAVVKLENGRFYIDMEAIK